MNARIHADRSATPDLRTEDDFSLPGWTYWDPEFFELERQVVFRKSWHLVCHVNDVREAGDYLTFRFLNESILTVRGTDGRVRSFHNVCRHRAARLVNGEQGNCGKRITCPYHAWTYSNEGRLVGVPRPTVGADVGAHQLSGTVPLPGPGQVIGEAGTLVKSQPHANAWHTVTLSQTYTNPVIVLSLLSYNGAQPTTLRVRNLASDRFQFQLDEWDYIDGGHTAETVAYLVVEAGTHTLEDGRRLEAGFTNAGTSPQSVSFAGGFTGAPVVLSQVVTTNDARAVVTRQPQVSASGFSVYVQGEEANTAHGSETVAWVALGGGVGATGSLFYEAGMTADAVTESWYGVDFGQSYGGSPVVLGSMQRDDGDNPAGLRFQSLSSGGVEVKVEEEQSGDVEVVHTTEPVGYVVFEPGLLTSSASLASVGSVPAALNTLAASSVMEQPEAYTLEENYPNPFNPQTTIRYALAEQAHVRLEVYNAVGQRVAVLVDQEQAGGVHEVAFHAASLPSGVYFCRFQAGIFTQTRSMILAK
jgi:nitrite reductase/ring-hydroxylating ferredoxin subunit